MTSLYGLTTEHTEIERLIDESYYLTTPPEGATPEERITFEESRQEVDAALIDQLLMHDGAVAQKVDAYCCLIREHEKRSAARKQESERIAGLAAADASLVRRLKSTLQSFMEATGSAKVAGVRFSVSIAANAGRPPLVMDAPDMTTISERFIVVTREVDRDALRDALSAGDPEAAAVAHLGERGSHVRIR